MCIADQAKPSHIGIGYVDEDDNRGLITLYSHKSARDRLENRRPTETQMIASGSRLLFTLLTVISQRLVEKGKEATEEQTYP